MRHVYQDQTIGGADILNSLADVNIGNPEDGQMLVYDASTQRWRNVTQKSLNDLAEVTDLTNVIATGSTNETGATIPKGWYFYLNDELCQAKVDIANGATFTLNTNYEVVTAGGLNSLNSAITTIQDTVINQRAYKNEVLYYTFSSSASTQAEFQKDIARQMPALCNAAIFQGTWAGHNFYFGDIRRVGSNYYIFYAVSGSTPTAVAITL